MKNVAINTLQYSGIVTFSQYIENKKVKLAQIHNTGGSSLFDFLAKCLAGDFTLAKEHRPTKIRLLRRYGSKPAEYTYESVTPFIFLRVPPESVATSGSETRVRFSFIVPKDLIELIY